MKTGENLASFLCMTESNKKQFMPYSVNKSQSISIRLQKGPHTIAVKKKPKHPEI